MVLHLITIKMCVAYANINQYALLGVCVWVVVVVSIGSHGVCVWVYGWRGFSSRRHYHRWREVVVGRVLKVECVLSLSLSLSLSSFLFFFIC